MNVLIVGNSERAEEVATRVATWLVDHGHRPFALASDASTLGVDSLHTIVSVGDAGDLDVHQRLATAVRIRGDRGRQHAAQRVRLVTFHREVGTREQVDAVAPAVEFKAQRLQIGRAHV